MGNIFFNLRGEFEEVVPAVFNALGITSNVGGDSLNVLGGQYSFYSVFGVRIKLELNSYDYEDEYKYMLSVCKDLMSNIQVDEKVEDYISEVVVRLLSKNLSIKVAWEKSDSLEIYF